MSLTLLSGIRGVGGDGLWLLHPGMAESPFAAFCFIDTLHTLPVDTCVACYNHLANAFAVVDGERFV